MLKRSKSMRWYQPRYNPMTHCVICNEEAWFDDLPICGKCAYSDNQNYTDNQKGMAREYRGIMDYDPAFDEALVGDPSAWAISDEQLRPLKGL